MVAGKGARATGLLAASCVLAVNTVPVVDGVVVGMTTVLCTMREERL